jgi:hypothetical protein
VHFFKLFEFWKRTEIGLSPQAQVPIQLGTPIPILPLPTKPLITAYGHLYSAATALVP